MSLRTKHALYTLASTISFLLIMGAPKRWF